MQFVLVFTGKSEDGNSLPVIIAVVIAAIIVIAVVAVAIIIVNRRQKNHTKEATPFSDLPRGLTNDAYKNSTEAGKSETVIETSNYDIINDELVQTYCLPEKNKKDTARVPGRAKKCGDVSADEYDKIEFETNGTIKASNYDTLHTMEGKIGDNPYSHASSQLKYVTAARGIDSDYFHCKLNTKYTLKNDDEYSHVDHEGDHQKNSEASNIEDYSYNHIDFDNIKHPRKNGKTVIGENESE
ncbi:hypothetical protein CHS0354_034039 [Potamilus streckersoni]|uniref:Uncharacterized protein n=1 Tax=Potamilus streckersoni TaxID=2493646 RepID=A0AAE0T1B7_9BIVA|nr:hypothetical protein CHS0354_034039 [Potamilus streckersoni]